MDEMFVGIMAEFFDRFISDDEYEVRAEKALAHIRRNNPNAKDFLELACGTGGFTRQLVKAGFKVTATDISPDEIQIARTKQIEASFAVADMSKLDGREMYDVVGCFWESFRYLPTFQVCQDTLHRIAKALRPGGMFLADFACFSPTKQPIDLPAKTIDVGDGLLVTQQVTLQTKGDYDVRSDRIKYERNGEDITGDEILWHGKKTLLKQTMTRMPQIRITKERMKEMLEKAGFKVLTIEGGFNGYPESTLFVAQK
ncbi:MAG: class I SAM-dependent methyltransferase [Candidatus Woesearchaeota archaeon]